MSRHFLKKRWHSGLFIILLLIVFNYYLSLKFTVIAPGITVDLKNIVTVENGNKDAKGSFFLTTVSSRTLNIPLLLYAAIDPYVNIEPKEEMIPPGWEIKKYIEYTKQWMKESQKIAEVVALRKAGYNPEIRGDGAQVVEIMTDSPARGKLFPGDIIKKVDGRRVNLADEMVKGVTSHKIGETVNLEVERKGRILNITVPTVESKTEKGKAVIGVYITTLNWKPLLPANINIDTGEIGGPSAGSMFVLEILNQLLPEDLTKGYKIAGTGTIGLDEQIGEIGGVQQKVIAAHRDGAQIFFVPEGNAGDAMLAARGLDIKVVPVRKLDDMLNYLRALK
jgi:PDZ domain-containing protein